MVFIFIPQFGKQNQRVLEKSGMQSFYSIMVINILSFPVSHLPSPSLLPSSFLSSFDSYMLIYKSTTNLALSTPFTIVSCQNFSRYNKRYVKPSFLCYIQIKQKAQTSLKQQTFMKLYLVSDFCLLVHRRHIIAKVRENNFCI